MQSQENKPIEAWEEALNSLEKINEILTENQKDELVECS